MSISHEDIKNVYFVGAGGIGMSALERYFNSRGISVAGYDRTPTRLTETLQAEGIDIVFDDDDALIPERFRNPADTLVVFTPAVPESHRGLSWFRRSGFTVMKRSEVLGLITAPTKSICFSGTHGKTTTSSMAAHALAVEGTGSNAFLGGVLRNYGSNLLLSADSPFSVVEADEFDRSFHRLRPYIAVVTATDPDHLDIYGTPEAYREGFARFTELIKPGGKLLVNLGATFTPRPPEGVDVFTYSRDAGDYHAANIRRSEGHIAFDLIGPGEKLLVADIEPGVPVEVNIDNTVAALAALDLAGHLDADAARLAMASYQGAERRFEYRLRRPDHIIIDDYAHHPREIEASIASVKALYPSKKLTVVFQPHLYSRTRDFAADFSRALSGADEVILVPLYPAREEPIPGVGSEMLLPAITAPVKLMTTADELAGLLASRGFEVLEVLGAGNIDDRIPEIINALPK